VNAVNSICYACSSLREKFYVIQARTPYRTLLAADADSVPAIGSLLCSVGSCSYSNVTVPAVFDMKRDLEPNVTYRNFAVL
jgi:hypothetical protein